MVKCFSLDWVVLECLNVLSGLGCLNGLYGLGMGSEVVQWTVWFWAFQWIGWAGMFPLCLCMSYF